MHRFDWSIAGLNRNCMVFLRSCDLIEQASKNFSNRKKIGQLTGAHMPEQASRLRYDLTTASARKVPYQITSSILNDPFRSLDLR